MVSAREFFLSGLDHKCDEIDAYTGLKLYAVLLFTEAMK